jgi:hypothetical protein
MVGRQIGQVYLEFALQNSGVRAGGRSTFSAAKPALHPLIGGIFPRWQVISPAVQMRLPRRFQGRAADGLTAKAHAAISHQYEP